MVGECEVASRYKGEPLKGYKKRNVPPIENRGNKDQKV